MATSAGMWMRKRKTLPQRKLSLKPQVKKPVKVPWVRTSLRDPQVPFDPTVEGFGLHPIFQVPTAPRPEGFPLDQLRTLNMGHINLQYHPEALVSPSSSEWQGSARSSKMSDPEGLGKGVSPKSIFVVPEIWKPTASPKTPPANPLDSVKSTVPGRKKSVSPDGTKRPTLLPPEEVEPSKDVTKGWILVDQGIGTARGASPVFKKLWEDEDAAQMSSIVTEDGLESFLLLKSVTFDDTKVLGESTAGRSLSATGLRLQSRSRKTSLWHERLNPPYGRPGKHLALLGGAALKAATNDMTFPSPLQLSADLEIHKPVNKFVRVPAPLVLRLPPRKTVEEQQAKLEKGGPGVKDKIYELGTLATSLRRMKDPHKYKDEARIVLCMAIIHDNAQVYSKALENYLRYLELCIKMKDVEGEAMCLNFIACSIQEDADRKAELSSTKIDFSQKEGDASLHPVVLQYMRACDYHMQHAARSDIEGKFIAFTNLGLNLSTRCEWADAAKFHKKALKCATFLQSPGNQCIAVGNLGFLLFRRQKLMAARVCITRYLSICQLLGDTDGLTRAHYTLGDIAMQQGRHKDAETEFIASMNAAKQLGDIQIETMSKVQLGVCRGEVKVFAQKQKFEEFSAETSVFGP